MKNKAYIGVSFIILIFGIYTIPKVVNYFSKPSKAKVLNVEEGKELTKKPYFAVFDKVPDFEFTNHKGKIITNKDYEGKVYIVEFFFTTCPTICPIMNTKMVSIQNEFFGNPQFGIASISINPKYDTPQILNDYAQEYNITSPNWNLLTGQLPETVYDLAKTGFKLYAGVGDKEVGGFEHSGLFALVDKQGNICSRFDQNGNPIMYYRAIKENEFGDQIEELKQDIKLLLKE